MYPPYKHRNYVYVCASYREMDLAKKKGQQKKKHAKKLTNEQKLEIRDQIGKESYKLMSEQNEVGIPHF